MPALFTIYSPSTANARGILTIPHSGTWIPSEFQGYLQGTQRDLDQDVDFAVPELVDIDALTTKGILVVVAHIHRVAMDLNRSPEKALLAWSENTQGVRLELSRPNLETSEALIHRYHAPYFELLKGLMHGQNFRCLDLHSMPSKPTAYHLQKNPHQDLLRPEFCCSDLSGKTLPAGAMDRILASFSHAGFQALANNPYQGGYGTEFASRYSTSAVQIEIRRNLYMDEAQQVLKRDLVEKLRPNLTGLVEQYFLSNP